MTKVVSDKQLAANRTNAKKSTGPSTAEGKDRGRLNALTHGLLAAQALVTDGDGAEGLATFDTILAGLYREFQPESLMVCTLVERLAACLWRLRRAHCYEVPTGPVPNWSANTVSLTPVREKKYL